MHALKFVVHHFSSGAARNLIKNASSSSRTSCITWHVRSYKTQFRPAHTQRIVQPAAYKQDENEKLHAIMENSKLYSGVLAQRLRDSFYRDHSRVDKEVAGDAPQPWIDFMQLTLQNETEKQNLEVSFLYKKYDKLCKNLAWLTDDQLVATLCALSKWKTELLDIKSGVFGRMWQALDAECTRRVRTLDKKHAFWLADLWFSLKLSRLSKYNTAFLKRFMNETDKLEKAEFVQVLFLINVQRTCTPQWALTIEDKLLHSLDEFDMGELTIASAAFFKSQSTMDPHLVLNITKRMKSELPNMTSFEVAILSKILYQKGNPPFLELPFLSLLEASCPYVERWDHLACVHMATVMPTMCLLHEKFLSAVTVHLSSKISNVRLKDLAQLLFCLCTLNYRPPEMPDVLQRFVSELEMPRREKEAAEFPHALITCLLNLSYQDVYSKPLLTSALSPDFMMFLRERTKVHWYTDVYKLDSSVRIERPDYTCVLSDEWRSEVKKMTLHNDTANTHWEKVFLLVKEDVAKLVPKGCIKTQRILEHFYYEGIIIHKIGRNFLPATQNVNYERPLQSNEKRIYIFVPGRGSYTTNGKLPLGPTIAYVRQLRKLNFTVVEMPWNKVEQSSNWRRFEFVRNQLKPYLS